jgi:hypothetical protein
MDQQPESTQQLLRAVIEQLSRPFESSNDIKVVTMRLDAIAAILLRSPYAVEKLGPARVSELAAADAELPAVLRAIGGEPFDGAASAAEGMIAVSRSSLVDFGTVDQEIAEANVAREGLSGQLNALLAAIS